MSDYDKIAELEKYLVHDHQRDKGQLCLACMVPDPIVAALVRARDECVELLESNERLRKQLGQTQEVPADVRERGWQWRPCSEDTAFAPPFGTIRQCKGCDSLVAGGPSNCLRCAREETK